MIRDPAREVAATSKHRASPCYEWSKQISRDVHPFFVPQPAGNQKGFHNSEKPRRHQPTVDFDRSASRRDDYTTVDTRQYEPKHYEELHPRCAVNIGKSSRGKTLFSTSSGVQSPLNVYPPDEGWGRGKKSWMPKAAKPKDVVDKLREEAASRSQDCTDIADASKSSSTLTFVDSRTRKPPTVIFGKADARPVPTSLDKQLLRINYEPVSRHQTIIDMRRTAARLAPERRSDRYRELFRTPPPPPLFTADRPRVTSGFAPTRSSSSLSVQDLLMNADADIKRARSVIDSTFGSHSRSELRTSMLYSPTPSL